MRLPLPMMALAILIAAPAVAEPPPIVPGLKLEGVGERYQARLRIVFREVFAPDVLVRAIVYSAGYPERAVALRQAGDTFKIVAVQAREQVSTYSLIEAMRAGEVRIGTLRRGGGIDDRTDEEADRFASTLPANPRDMPLSRCTVAADAELAAAIQAAWRRLRPKLPVPEAAHQAGMAPVYLFPMGKDEREAVDLPWEDEPDSPSGRMMRIVDEMDRYCPSRGPHHAREIIGIAGGPADR